MISRHQYSSPAYDELIANHTIVLLTYVAENPNEWQSYGILSKATGVPKSTIWGLLHWRHEDAPQSGTPIFVWANMLGFEVVINYRKGRLLSVCKMSYFGSYDW